MSKVAKFTIPVDYGDYPIYIDTTQLFGVSPTSAGACLHLRNGPKLNVRESIDEVLTIWLGEAQALELTEKSN